MHSNFAGTIMNIKKYSILYVLVLLLAITTCGCMEQAQNETPVQDTGTMMIKDMQGRELSVPKNITKVYATSPPSTILIYMLAPEKLAGWNFVNKFNHTLMDERYLSLPVMGGWYGTQTGSYETISKLAPDLVIEGYTTDRQGDAVERRQEMFGNIPVVAIDESIVFVERSDPTIEYVGKLLDAREKAADLIRFRTAILSDIKSKVSDIPPEKRVRVYYAEGPKGLMTDPSGSQHSQVIDICGAINVADCPLTPGAGNTPVSIEQVMSWKPDVILTSSPQFYATVYSDPLWSDMSAVKNKRVYLSPMNPYCWIDRPQGPHLIIGTAWTAKVLYPELFADMDIEKLTREFYADFFHYDLTDKDLKMLLNT